MSDSTTEEKTEDASRKRVKKGREQGQTLSVVTGNKAMSFVGVLLGVAVGFPAAAAFYVTFFDDSMRIVDIGPGRIAEAIEALSGFVLWVFAGLLVASFLPVLIFSVIVKNGFNFSVIPLKPNFSRLNPATNLKSIFERTRLVMIFFDIVKITAWLVVIFIFARLFVYDMLRLFTCGVTCEIGFLATISLYVLVMMLVFIAAVLFFEIPLERMHLMKQMRMTKTEVKKERKEQHGDPEVVKVRRKMSEQIKMGLPVGAEYATAVVQSNGTTIALHYDPDDLGIPVVVDIGADERSSQVLRKARKSGAVFMKDERYGVMIRRKAIGDMLTEKEEYMPVLRAMSAAGKL